jgi:hypothetical protein
MFELMSSPVSSCRPDAKSVTSPPMPPPNSLSTSAIDFRALVVSFTPAAAGALEFAILSRTMTAAPAAANAPRPLPRVPTSFPALCAPGPIVSRAALNAATFGTARANAPIAVVTAAPTAPTASDAVCTG